MPPEQKKSIDNMSYESMLALWRNAPVGHLMFAGDIGDYYAKIMKEKRKVIGAAGHTNASKNIGWTG